MKRILFLDLNGDYAQTLHYYDSSVANIFTSTFSPGSDLFVAAFSTDTVITESLTELSCNINLYNVCNIFYFNVYCYRRTKFLCTVL